MDSLYDYQIDVINECMTIGSGSINCPMGYGKTLMSICLAMRLTEDNNKPLLFIMSKTLISNWLVEFKKFFGEIPYIVYHRKYIKNLESYKLPSDVKIVITTPDVVRTIYKFYEIEDKFIKRDRMNIENRWYNTLSFQYKEFIQLHNPISKDSMIYSTIWGCVIIDEIQNYTNVNSVRFEALASIYSLHKWGTSGTLFNEPSADRLIGYFILLDRFEMPRKYHEAIEYVKSDNFTGYLPTTVTRTKIPNYVKTKENKIIINHKLNNDEIKLFSIMKKCFKIIKQKLEQSGNNTDLKRKFNSQLISVITYMQQMTISPLLPLTNCLIDLIDNSELSKLITNEFKKENLIDYLNNENSVISSRLKEIKKVIDKNINDKIVVFTYFRMNLDILKNIILNDDREIFNIESNMSITQRENELSDFKKSDNGILLLTYAIGSEGLNLQESNIMIFTDLYWNFGKMEQAKARIVRPGQMNDVKLYYFTSNIGIENSILNKLSDKIDMEKEIRTGKILTSIKTLKVKDIIKFLDDDINEKLTYDILEKY